jgi:hypothetical protein
MSIWCKIQVLRNYLWNHFEVIVECIRNHDLHVPIIVGTNGDYYVDRIRNFCTANNISDFVILPFHLEDLGNLFLRVTKDHKK